MMPTDPLQIIRAYPDHLRERIRRLNRLPVQEERTFVLYWMHHAVRGHENPALGAAISPANILRKPILVYQGLGGCHPYNSDRHYTFIMEGCREVQRELTYRNISYCFHLNRDPATPTPLMKIAAQSALTLTAELAELCGRCRIDHTIAPVPHTQGGSTAG